MALKQYTLADVAAHKTADDAWITINGLVLNVTKFLEAHPGGKKILLGACGSDASKQFAAFHKPAVLEKYGKQFGIGVLQGHPGAAKWAAAAKPVAAGAKVPKLLGNAFGELTPYGDPCWYQDWNSPYYKDSHRRLRAAMRDWVEKEAMPNIHDWDEQKKLPAEIYRKAYQAGFLPGVVGPPWPTKYAGTNIVGGVKPEEFDAFHELIIDDEVARTGSGGFCWGLYVGLMIGMPPVMLFGSEYLREKVCAPCLRGEKLICLSITEPTAGSDVANIATTAVKSADGKYYTLNGQKKWITNGVWADFFTVACRTGGKGMGGISLLLVERAFKGVTTKQLQCQGVWSSGTTYITFEDVKVPAENLIGKENEGFKYIMYNFNHERWALNIQAIRFARVCLEEAMKYAHKRRTFGKLLIEHPVIRLKLAHMARQVEASQAQLELVTYQMTTMNKEAQNKLLGGPIALLKAQATTAFEYCAREAAQIFGGLAYTRGGQGEKVERLYREVRAYAMPGGSEEIMLDLGIRQALKTSSALRQKHGRPSKI